MQNGGPETSPTLLKRVQAWNDQSAWSRFFDQYQPLLDQWSRRSLRNPSDVAELTQRLFCELSRRLTEFRYDPARSFRGWLKTLHHRRLLDFLDAERRRELRERQLLEVRGAARWSVPSAELMTTRDPAVGQRADQRARAARIQERVRARITEKSWSIFLEIAVEGHSIADTAHRHSMKYASAFAAFSRVQKMLQNEAAKDIGVSDDGRQ